jgi:N-ethylmaleimide reductase
LDGEALTSVWSADRVGVRIAPSGTFNGMADTNPRALFRYVAERLNDSGWPICMSSSQE